MSSNRNDGYNGYTGVCMEVAGAESMPVTGVGPDVIGRQWAQNAPEHGSDEEDNF